MSILSKSNRKKNNWAIGQMVQHCTSLTGIVKSEDLKDIDKEEKRINNNMTY